MRDRPRQQDEPVTHPPKHRAPAAVSKVPLPARWTHPRVALPALILFALGLRLLLIATSAGVLRDAFQFILQAELLTAERWDLALRCPQHPLTAALIALVQPLVGDWLLAGQVVSSVCGALVLVPVFLLTRDIVGSRAGLVAAAAAAVSPYLVRYSAHVLSDAPYWLLMSSALALGWWALSRRRLVLFPPAGVVCGLAYLTRPEGLTVPAIILLGCVVFVVRGPRRRRAALGAGLFLAAFLAVGGPYAVVIGGPTLKKDAAGVIARLAARPQHDLATTPPKQTARVTTTRRSVPRTRRSPVRTPPGASRRPRRRPALHRLTNAAWKIICQYSETWHYYLLLLGVIGLFLRRVTRWRRGGAPYLAAVVFLNVICHLFLHAAEGYVARRYAVAVGLIALTWTGAGWLELAALLVALFGRGRPRTRRTVTLILVAVLLGSTLPKALKTQQRSKAGFRQAGRWLAEHSPPDAAIMISSHPDVGPRALRVGFYAGGYPPMARYIATPGEPLREPAPGAHRRTRRWWPSPLPELWDLPDDFPLTHRRRLVFAPGTRRWSKLRNRLLGRRRIDYLVVDHEEIDRRFGHFRRLAERVPELKLLKAFPVARGEPDSIFIYQVVRPARASSRPVTTRRTRTRPAP